MVKKKQVLQSGIWQILNVSVKVFSQFAYYAVMARLLTKPELGVFAILNSFINLGNILGDGGMGDALMQRKDHEKEHVNAAFAASFVVSLVFYAALFIGAPFIAEFYTDPELTFALRIFGFMFVFASLYSPSYNLLQKKFKFKKIFIGDGLMLLLSNVFGIWLAYAGYGVMSLVYSQLFYYGCSLILYFYYEPLPLRLGFKKRHWNDLLGYGTGLTLIRANTYIANYGIVLEIGKMVSKASLAMFDRTYRIMNIPQRFLYDMVQRLMMATLVSKSGSQKGTFSVFKKTLSFMVSLLVPLSLYLVIFSKPIILILLSEKYLDALLLMQILFLNLPMRTIASLGDSLMRVHGLIKLNLIRKVQNSVAILAFIFIGYKVAGLEGIGVGVLASTILSYVMMMAIIKKRIFPENWKELVFKPYKNGLMLCLIWVLPAGVLYWAMEQFIHDSIVSFCIVSGLLGLVAAAAFLKKPVLLGSDIASIQQDILSIFSKKNKKKKQQVEDEEVTVKIEQQYQQIDTEEN